MYCMGTVPQIAVHRMSQELHLAVAEGTGLTQRCHCVTFPALHARSWVVLNNSRDMDVFSSFELSTHNWALETFKVIDSAWQRRINTLK